MSLDDHVEEWNICFIDVPDKHWVQPLLEPGFRHCYAFKTSPGGQFLIIVEPMRSHLDIDLVPNTEENLNKLKNCHKLVKVVVKYYLKSDRGHFCRFNCVEVVKSLLGIKSFFTWTPYQLYKRLLCQD